MLVAKKTLLLLSLLFAVLLPATARSSADCDHTLSFADALFADGDHYRAVTEYKRFLHLCASDSRMARAALGIAESYLGGRRWEQAEGALQRVVDDYPASEAAARAALLRCRLEEQRESFALARQCYQSLRQGTDDAQRRRELAYRTAWTLIEEGAFAEAGEALRQIETERAYALAAEAARLEEVPRKSPRLAGGLSALLPGAGQLYAGRPREAGLAFALNAAFILGALESFEAGNEVVGSILVFFELGWYAGNIFNAANSAHKHNRDLLEAEKAPLRERFGLSVSAGRHQARLGLTLHF